MKTVYYFFNHIKMDSKQKQIKDIVSTCIDNIVSCGIVLSIEQQTTIDTLRSELMNQIENILMEETKPDTNVDPLDLPGICCFCGYECNPLSQSCGSCARCISGAAFGIPVPEYLKKFI